MTATTLALAGIIINAVGTILVFIFGVPARVKASGEVFLITGEYDEEDHRRERRSTFWGWVGLVMIVLGAGLQGWALFFGRSG